MEATRASSTQYQMSSRDISNSKPHRDRPRGAAKVSKATVAVHPTEQALKLPKNLSRRSHTKSRRGCFTCKSRKIKCDEGIPACSHCRYRGTTCTYPQHTGNGANAARLPLCPGQIFVPFQPKLNLLQSPSEKLVFTAQEMRFFHYFLTSMKHPLPLGNRSVWVQEIPQISHEYPFLLHAILALGASEMERSNLPLPLQYDVLKHRGRAIAGLNKALDDSKAWSTYGHPDAVLATCYALIYQSSRIADGMKDFQVLVQGCALITNKIQQSNLKTVINVSPDWPRHKIDPGVRYIQANLHDSHMALVKSGLETLKDIQASSVLSDELLFWKACAVTLEHFASSPLEGYTFSIIRYSAWYYLAGGMLNALRRQDNWTVLVLIASFLANMILLKVLIPLQIWPEGRDRLPICTLRRMLRLIEAIDEHVEESHRRHLAWAKQVVQLVPELPPEINYDRSKSKLTSSKTAILDDLQTSSHMFLGDILRLGSEVTAWFEEYVSDMYQASRRHLQPTEPMARVPSPSPVPLASSTMTMSYPSPSTAEQPLAPFKAQSTDRLTTANSVHTEEVNSYPEHSPNISVMDSNSFPFRIFSGLDQAWNEGDNTFNDGDDMNANDEIYDLFSI